MGPPRPRERGTGDRHPWWTYVDWPGIVAVVLAIGISFSMIVAMVGAVSSKSPLSDQGSQLLSSIFGAAIGAVATYLGMAQRGAAAKGRTRHGDDPQHGEHEPPPE